MEDKSAFHHTDLRELGGRVDGLEGRGDGNDVVLHDARPVLDVADLLEALVELLAQGHPLPRLPAEARCLRLQLARLVVQQLLVHVHFRHTCACEKGGKEMKKEGEGGAQQREGEKGSANQS